MIRFEFTATDAEAETILNCIQEEIVKTHERLQQAMLTEAAGWDTWCESRVQFLENIKAVMLENCKRL